MVFVVVFSVFLLDNIIYFLIIKKKIKNNQINNQNKKIKFDNNKKIKFDNNKKNQKT